MSSQSYLLTALVGYSILSTGVVGYLWGTRHAAQPPAPPERQETTRPNSPTVKTVIQWLKYDEGLKLAKAQNKPIYIQFHANWCPYCKRMDTDVYPDKSIKTTLHQEFIPIRIEEKSPTKVLFEGQEITEGELLQKFQVTGFPTHLLLDANGKVIKKHPGFVDVATLKALLQAAQKAQAPKI